jgi:crotonobetainyl-CoA:carnitine CoA-transferase CaiB-like acyl-CoA transferase
MPASSEAPKTPMGGFRVLDLSRILAGPYATMVLGDLGAEVIKIERPDGGDDTRAFLPPETAGISTYFLTVNRNKKSVTLDLSRHEGRDAFLTLAAEADVIVENYRTGVTQRLGIDYDAVRQVNPSIIYASISGYGRDGPAAMRPAVDPILQAESGLMTLTGEADGAPMRTGVSLVDVVAGLFAAQAISAALLHRQSSGEGQFLEVALYDSAVAMLANFSGNYLLAGSEPRRVGNGNQVAQPVGLFHAADGDFMLAVTSNRLFRRLAETVLRRPALADDPAFADTSARLRNGSRLIALMNEIFATGPVSQWLDRLSEAGIPAGRIQSVAEALDAPLTKARGLIENQQHTTLGTIPTLASPMRLAKTPVSVSTGAPLLGEHTETVLREIGGFDDTAIAALRAAGILGGEPEL